eukprot:4824001-Amphidinium_carterae.1
MAQRPPAEEPPAHHEECHATCIAHTCHRDIRPRPGSRQSWPHRGWHAHRCTLPPAQRCFARAPRHDLH